MPMRKNKPERQKNAEKHRAIMMKKSPLCNK
jgi:hypothetical protein